MTHEEAKALLLSREKEVRPVDLTKIKQLYHDKLEAEDAYRKANPCGVTTEYKTMKDSRRAYSDACIEYVEQELAMAKL